MQVVERPYARSALVASASALRLRAMRTLGPLILIAYVVVGAFVAATSGYFQGLGELENILSAILAILLWPLVLIGFDVKVT